MYQKKRFLFIGIILLMFDSDPCRWSQLGLAFLTLLDIVLVSRVNLTFGISDRIMVLCGSALSDAINQFKYVYVWLICNSILI